MDTQPIWDTLISGALIFDGTGTPPQRIDLAIKNGQIAAKGIDLPRTAAATVIDGQGKWLMPGLLDIHTHFDLEVEVEPALTEAVRHGTTTVVMSNCSLGLAFGALTSPERPEENPLIDCFARVENMPKRVLERCLDGTIDWHDSGSYLHHLEQLPLGPNVAPMVPHSMLRIAVMGLEGSISREPTAAELQQMCALVEQAMQQGYVGFSSDGLPLHYLANDPHRNEKIPAQHATLKEIRALAEVVRRHDRVWQATPDPEDGLKTLGIFGLTCGRLHGRPLTMTATAAMDIDCNQFAHRGLRLFSRLLNSRLLRGDFTFQALSVPFKVFADGVSSPLLEEKPAFRELMAIDIEDVEHRQRLLNDAGYVARFRRDWRAGKEGFNLNRLRHWLKMESTTFSRELDDMVVERAPIALWSGQRLGEVYRRLRSYQQGDRRSAASSEEAGFFAAAPPINDDADFMLHLLRQFDRALRWYVITANQRPEVLRELLFDPQTLPGFNDSGAHLTNMAYFDGNLSTLKMAAQESLDQVSLAVKRLTRDPARLFRMEVGTLEMAAQADLILVDPQALLDYDSDAGLTMIHREVFDHPQLVNRSDGVVDKVWIAGKLAWDGATFTPEVGKERFGRLMTARAQAAA